MSDMLQARADAIEDWWERGWHFRLHVSRSGGGEAIEASQLLALMKRLIKSHIVPIIDPAEVTKQGFAIGSCLTCGKTRIQVCWWTLERELRGGLENLDSGIGGISA
jgi:hypothetical protein